jgi:hypothetical protein
VSARATTGPTDDQSSFLIIGRGSEQPRDTRRGLALVPRRLLGANRRQRQTQIRSNVKRMRVRRTSHCPGAAPCRFE